MEVVFKFFFGFEFNGKSLEFLNPLTPYIIAFATIISSWLILSTQLKNDRKKRNEEAERIEEDRLLQKKDQALSKVKNFISLYDNMIINIDSQIVENYAYAKLLKEKPLEDTGRLQFTINANLDRLIEIDYESMRDAFHFHFRDVKNISDKFEILYHSLDYSKAVIEEFKRIDIDNLAIIFDLKVKAAGMFENISNEVAKLQIHYQKGLLGYYKHDRIFLNFNDIVAKFYDDFTNHLSDLEYIRDNYAIPIRDFLHYYLVLFDDNTIDVIEKIKKFIVTLSLIQDSVIHLSAQIKNYTDSLLKERNNANEVLEEFSKKGLITLKKRATS